MKFLAGIRHIALGTVAALALLLVTTALPASTPPIHAATNCDVADASLDVEELAFLNLINNYRAQNGAPALVASATLNRAAVWMSADMAVYNYFNHTDRLGRAFDTRIAQCDHTGNYVSENIAAWYDSAASVFDGWKNSPGHNTNMLNANFRSIGIARVVATLPTSGQTTPGFYWTTDFSAEVVQAGAPPAPPAPPANPACVNPGIDLNPRSNTGTAGTTFVISVTAVCNSPAYQFWVGKAPSQNALLLDPNVAWSVLQPYGGVSNASWTPTVPGFYYVRVWIKNGVNSTPTNGLFDTFVDLNQMVINPAAGNAPCSAPNIDVNPRTNFGNVGTRFTVSVSAVCATPAYQFWVGKAPSANTDVFDPSVQWQVLQSYSGTNSAAWTPGGPGFYHVRVWVKNGVNSMPANGSFDTATGLNIMTIN